MLAFKVIYTGAVNILWVADLLTRLFLYSACQTFPIE